MILLAQSSSENDSIVAPKASNPAFRACTKGSRTERENAAISTFDLVYIAISMMYTRSKRQLTPGERFFAIFPRQIVVFVRIPGCSSFAVRAKNRSNSPLITLSDNFPITVKTALTVCSRTTGATSVNPEV